MIRDPDQLQHDLDVAQADLQRHVGELKHLVERKLEGPKHVIDETRHAIAVVKKPFAWLDTHAVLATIAALVVGGLVALRGRRRFRRRLLWK
jgi:hypothetical protein